MHMYGLLEFIEPENWPPNSPGLNPCGKRSLMGHGSRVRGSVTADDVDVSQQIRDVDHLRCAC